MSTQPIVLAGNGRTTALLRWLAAGTEVVNDTVLPWSRIVLVSNEGLATWTQRKFRDEHPMVANSLVRTRGARAQPIKQIIRVPRKGTFVGRSHLLEYAADDLDDHSHSFEWLQHMTQDRITVLSYGRGYPPIAGCQDAWTWQP